VHFVRTECEYLRSEFKAIGLASTCFESIATRHRPTILRCVRSHSCTLDEHAGPQAHVMS
jgi:hypothetical protein